LCLNNPQYHRIHHSVEPQHLNKNFCRIFPVFDVIFGTAWRPGKDEFPVTGLMPRETATGFLDGIIWPVRHKLLVQVVSVDDQPVHLTAKEYGILELLSLRKGTTLTKEIGSRTT
jgi:hypothetical protein